MANSANPLASYFRQPSTYVRLPTLGRWYTEKDIELTQDGEVAVYPMTGIDDILLNTPDAMLNGQALEKVIKNCVPSIHNIKKILVNDLDAIFVGIKNASSGGKIDYDRKCPKCEKENNFELSCQSILDRCAFVDENDLTLTFNDTLVVHIKPYNFEMRQLYIRKEFEQEKMIRAVQAANKDMDEMQVAALMGDGIYSISKITFDLVSRSIEKIVLIKEGKEVTDPDWISEWLVNIDVNQANEVIKAAERLNETGIEKKLTVQCQFCDHSWEDQLSFDPTSFFGKRS